MEKDTVYVFTRNGLGHAPEDLSQKLAGKFLTLTLETGNLPAKIIFYTEGVKLACQGSPVIDQLKKFEAEGVELILCQTCLDYFKLAGTVSVGIVGGMGDIIEALQKATKIVNL